MASYEDDHNLPRTPRVPRRRPAPTVDLDSLFTSSLPSAASASAAFRALASTYSTLSATHTPLLESILDTLTHDATSEVPASGVPEGFTDMLERVPKTRLKEADTCPICNTPFLEDKFPLVVRLPCHRDHLFDLECIAPWLKLKSTCPLDRKDLVKKKSPPPPPPQDEDEEEWDDAYG